MTIKIALILLLTVVFIGIIIYLLASKNSCLESYYSENLRVLPSNEKEFRTYLKTLPAINMIIHPMMYYNWVDWYLTSNDTISDSKYIRIPAKHLKNISQLSHGDILYVENNKLDDFCNMIELLSTPIILITGRYNIPRIEKSTCTMKILSNKWIKYWLSQNPLDFNDPKYIPIPYGANPEYNFKWIDILYKEILKGDPGKSIKVAHFGLAETSSLRNNLISYMDPRKPIKEYYEYIHKSEAIISPPGDRWDCFRHYEAILLGCYPLSIINEKEWQYRKLMPEILIELKEKELLKCAKTRNLENFVFKPISYSKRAKYLQPYWYFHLKDLKKKLNIYNN